MTVTIALYVSINDHKSYDLVEYGISRGKSIRRPSQKPDRQILSVMPEADIDAMFENN